MVTLSTIYLSLKCKNLHKMFDSTGQGDFIKVYCSGSGPTEELSDPGVGHP